MFTGLTVKNVGLLGGLITPAPPPSTYSYSVPSTLDVTISVAAGYTSMLVKLWGQGGAQGPFVNGGNGAFVKATLPIAGGGTLNFQVAGAGGGIAGGNFARVRYNAPGGGGNQDIVAGGGGGPGDAVGAGLPGGPGGDAGATNGVNGSPGNNTDTTGGGGGTQVGGGTAGTGSTVPNNGTAGSSYQGGNGGSFIGLQGGGGGGGYFGGGGGGGSELGDGAGGGGGSCFVNASATSVTNAGPNTSDPAWDGTSSTPGNGSQLIIVLS